MTLTLHPLWMRCGLRSTKRPRSLAQLPDFPVAFIDFHSRSSHTVNNASQQHDVVTPTLDVGASVRLRLGLCLGFPFLLNDGRQHNDSDQQRHQQNIGQLCACA
jgi:hypothetical protein